MAVLINSSELRDTGFNLKELRDTGFNLPPSLETTTRDDLYTRGVGLRSLEGMVPKRFVLSVDDNTEFRSRCE